jgi:DNA-binding transcriptional MerR regulator
MAIGKSFFTVGELSALTGVSKQAIRYYDKIGLLKPGSVDAQNAYRYYEPIHVLYLNTITRLSQLGCSLMEIKKYISCGNIKDVMNMLSVRRNLTEKKIAELKSAFNTLEKQISIIEDGSLSKNRTDVFLKHCPARRFIYIENEVQPSIKQAILQISQMVKKMEERGMLFVCSPVFEYKKEQHILKTGFFYDETPDAGPFSADIVPEGTYACIFHKGKYDDTPQTVSTLYRYIEDNCLEAMSNIFQLYIIDYALTQKEDELLTELQMRVGKNI